MFASEQLMAAKSAVSRVEAVIQEKTLPEAAQKQKPTETGIVFKNVSFSYPRASEKALDVKFSYEKDKQVLRDVSFTAKQGQVTALVGPSGGGKSTVAKLAAKFYPLDGGKILLGGKDI